MQKQDATRTKVAQIQDKSYYLSLLLFSLLCFACYVDSTNSLILAMHTTHCYNARTSVAQYLTASD